MALNLFGYQITRRLDKVSAPEEKKPEIIVKSIVPKEAEDGSQTISAGGYFGQYIDIDGTTVASDQDLILKYRNAAMEFECDHAVNCIVDEAIVSSDDQAPVTLTLDDLDYDNNIKEEIFEEFDHIVKLLDFNRKSTDIFRQWYVDGRCYYHVIIDEKNAKNGIQEVRYIDPMKMRKVREVETTIDPRTGVNLVETKAEYFVYNEQTIPGQLVTTISSGDNVLGIKIDPNAVVYIPSGILDSTRKRVISYLHKALKPVNQLRMMEDSLVIYRISRAPERRIFYVDVGNLPKGKAEEYMQGIMSKYRNKLVYDAQTGAVRDDRRHMSMLEDFWLPRREGGRGTEITTLPGGENLGQIDDILYFKKALYKCMNVPLSRFDNESAFSVGRVTEISREEVSFQKFVNRLRKKFSYLFIHLLKTQLLLKGIITDEDWDHIKENIRVDFQRDNFFTELKEAEILKERLSLLDTLGDKIGKYYSERWVRRHVLRQSDEDIDKMDEEILDEKSEGISAENPQGEIDNPDMDGDGEGDGPPAEEDSLNSTATLADDENMEAAAENTDQPLTTDIMATPDSEDTMEMVEDGEAVRTLGMSGIKDLVDMHGLKMETQTSALGNVYVRVTNPTADKTALFDPSITTKKGFVTEMGIL